MADRSTYRDPTFDEVARREEAEQRAATRAAKRAEYLATRRADPIYRRMRARRIRRLVAAAMSGQC
ncbi:hypothetical protein [Chitiniphilus eburneus]|uniref:Uncharacterized protein n=1 Tax=Chitiniphilus eburneus TaxID=2571148 RepID=A0A4V5MQN7_9NEIS|nr:hypothetical protein [Chitiniphilus eburneus]TJZ73178.1 hypothetical protein FAZ21_11205 [Chitiniphilus eburneus]